MNNPDTLFHLWGYVIISYVLVFLCCAILGIGTWIRFRHSKGRLILLELTLQNAHKAKEELASLQHNEVP